MAFNWALLKGSRGSSFLVLLLGMTSCTKASNFEKLPLPPPAPAVVIPLTPSATPTSPPITQIITNLKPSLAIRGMGCLMCHANIQGNVITDFGNGDDAVFMGGGNQQFTSNAYGPPEVASPWYINMFGGWSTSKINGTVYIPAVSVPLQAQNSVHPVAGSFSDSSLATFLTTPIRGNGNGKWDQPSNVDTLYGVQQNPKTISVENLWIGAPTTADLLNLAPSLKSNSVSGAWVTVGDPTQLQGLVGDSQKTFTTNVQPNSTQVLCNGDVVIKGPLYLRNLKLNTLQGCRLYVAGTVFIEGPITFVGANGTSSPSNSSNLQISSSIGIYMGISDDPHALNEDNRGPNKLSYRIFNDSRNRWIRSGSWSDQANLIFQDFRTIHSIYPIKDAGNPATLCENNAPCPTEQSFLDFPRASISYRHVLFNAPVIESRYLGQIQGVVIGELGLFSLGSFQYAYDPIFESVPVLPLISQNPATSPLRGTIHTNSGN